MKLKIFYVDDEIELCEIFLELFNSEDCEILTFTDPQLAIKAARKCAPDLVFMDYRLPGVTGDKVAIDMKCNSPIYLISGDLFINTAFEFKQILTKPVVSEDIRKIITMHVIEKKANDPK